MPRVIDESVRVRKAEADRLRDQFIADLGVKPRQAKWTRTNIVLMFKMTCESREAVAEMIDLFDALSGNHNHVSWATQGGVFDHGTLWRRDRVPSVVVGHPYGIGDDMRAMLDEMARFKSLKVSIDDRPSFYGFGTNHVRIELNSSR